MQKSIYLFLVASSICNVSAMGCWDGDQHSPRGENPQALVTTHEQAPQVVYGDHRSEDSIWNLLEYVTDPFVTVLNDAVTSVRNSLDQLDDAMGAGAHERQQEVNRNAAHIAILLNELKTKTLPEAISDAAKQSDPRKFLSLLIGMKAQGMQPGPESKEVIHSTLNCLQLKRRQETKELVERRMKEEREIHALRAEYRNTGEKLSDDESYTDLNKFADRLVNDEE
jgi:hypothetical protein